MVTNKIMPSKNYEINLVWSLRVLVWSIQQNTTI